MDEPNLNVTTAKVADLVPYANNAKKHPDAQVEQIARSIEEFGFCDPIAVWHNADGDPEIVEGHGRLLALQLRGIEEAPVVALDHLTDEQRRAYAHVHNQLTMNTGFDYSVLDADLETLDFDWEAFGFEHIGFDWADGVEELTEESYDPPERAMVRCPKCGHVDSRLHFKKV